MSNPLGDCISTDPDGNRNCSGDLCVCERPIMVKTPDGQSWTEKVIRVQTPDGWRDAIEWHTVVACTTCGTEQINHPFAVEARKLQAEQKAAPKIDGTVQPKLDYAFGWIDRIRKLEAELVAERARSDQIQAKLEAVESRLTMIEEAETAPEAETTRKRR